MSNEQTNRISSPGENPGLIEEQNFFMKIHIIFTGHNSVTKISG